MAEIGRAATRGLADEFRQASDAKILKITRMIDQMPERGKADALLDPIRDRLAALRPSRPMNWTRLLFVPFDPVLVPTGQWRPGQFALPRSVLMPVVDLLGWSAERRQGRPPLPPEPDAAELLRVAAPLWSEAAVLLATASVPEAWHSTGWQKESGLTAASIKSMLPAIRSVLAHAATIRSLPQRPENEKAGTVERLLSTAMPAGTLAWGLTVTLLFGVAPLDEVARVASSMVRPGATDPALQSGLDQAIATMLDRIENHSPEFGTVEDRLALIGRVDGLSRLPHRPAEEQKRVRRLRVDLAENNREMFGRMMDARLPQGSAASLEESAGTGELPDEAVLALEAGMRQLREFALAASRLGDAAEYERLLERAAARCEMVDGAGGLSAVERLRMVELLVGGDRALRSCGIG